MNKTFLKGEKRENALVSKLVSMEIKRRKKNGENASAEEIDKIKFAYDPIFKQKVIDKVHFEADKEYNSRVENAKNKLRGLENSRSREIKRIEESRWETIVSKKIRFNITE